MLKKRSLLITLVLALIISQPIMGRYYSSDLGVWTSVDPKAHKYPGVSPYAYVMNNPLINIDPDGRDIAFAVDKNGAGGNGHTTLYFQNETGQWYSFNQGATNGDSSGGNLWLLLGQSTDAGVSISEVNEVPKGALLLHTTPEQDEKIAGNALIIQNEHKSGASKYNLYSNNCTDAAVDVVNTSKSGITVENSSTTVKPNTWFKELKNVKVQINTTSGDGVDNTKVILEIPKYEEVK